MGNTQHHYEPPATTSRCLEEPFIHKMTDQEAIDTLQKNEEAKLSNLQAVQLYNRYNTLTLYRDWLRKNEPFKHQGYLQRRFTTKLFTQLRIAGTYKETKIVLFQFTDSVEVFILFETGIDSVTYRHSEETLRRWSFEPLVRQNNKLIISMMREEVKDNIRFVYMVSIQPNPVDAVTEK